MARSSKPARFLSQQEQDQVKAAVAAAERLTSGEIRVYLESRIPWFRRDPYVRARQVFAQLGMHATEERNGVLVYLATATHCFAVVGDESLHRHVGDGFWQSLAGDMLVHFREDRFGDGLAQAVETIGARLARHFPRQADDVNELPDEIAFGG